MVIAVLICILCFTIGMLVVKFLLPPIPGLRQELMFDLASIRKRYARGIRIACNGNASAERLAEILQPFRPGATPITVRYANERLGGNFPIEITR